MRLSIEVKLEIDEGDMEWVWGAAHDIAEEEDDDLTGGVRPAFKELASEKLPLGADVGWVDGPAVEALMDRARKAEAES